MSDIGSQWRWEKNEFSPHRSIASYVQVGTRYVHYASAADNDDDGDDDDDVADDYVQVYYP